MTRIQNISADPISKEIKKEYPREEPTENDVLMLYKEQHQHPGNKRYYKILSQHQVAFEQTGRFSKKRRDIISLILDVIRDCSPPTRFLKRSNGGWVVQDEQKYNIRRKISEDLTRSLRNNHNFPSSGLPPSPDAQTGEKNCDEVDPDLPPLNAKAIVKTEYDDIDFLIAKEVIKQESKICGYNAIVAPNGDFFNNRRRLMPLMVLKNYQKNGSVRQTEAAVEDVLWETFIKKNNLKDVTIADLKHRIQTDNFQSVYQDILKKEKKLERKKDMQSEIITTASPTNENHVEKIATLTKHRQSSRLKRNAHKRKHVSAPEKESYGITIDFKKRQIEVKQQMLEEHDKEVLSETSLSQLKTESPPDQRRLQKEQGLGTHPTTKTPKSVSLSPPSDDDQRTKCRIPPRENVTVTTSKENHANSLNIKTQSHTTGERSLSLDKNLCCNKFFFEHMAKGNKWICHACMEVVFDSYEEALKHESMCRISDLK
eukprot:CAMPEP_0172522058 /NCGR_PEP_ID=MMETSP1066-20121228/292918_1 /TAXON_ID=671091 /ORGANISM="Coscinodiscus wailesii, Strain CCMP2513" /LENGTH=484 /DNA_ID=CAMNT_0013305027 /DNA_START=133 /DNA_END=1588 /DNA_ORIENTATION=+